MKCTAFHTPESAGATVPQSGQGFCVKAAEPPESTNVRCAAGFYTNFSRRYVDSQIKHTAAFLRGAD